jgi:hypothetical protein
MSTATQKLAVGHETAVRLVAGSMLAGADQLVPLCVIACPVPSTTAQKLAVGHDKELMLLAESMLTGADQLAATAGPAESTRTATATAAPAARRKPVTSLRRTRLLLPGTVELAVPKARRRHRLAVNSDRRRQIAWHRQH